MRISAILALPLFVLVASCGGGGGADAAKTTVIVDDTINAASLPLDTAVISKIYDPNYSVPEGFFVDERANTAQSYTVHHVMDESNSFEVCTDDFSVAAAWEDADNASRSVNGYYVGAVENERYFEFVRELSYNDDVGNINDVTSPGFARVFKCSNTVRDGVDRSLLSGFAGLLNTRPLNTTTVKDFAEYLWQFAFFPERYKKVLDSYPQADGGGQTLLLGFASTQGNDQCDLIEIVEWRFSIAAATGSVTSEFEIVHSFSAELIDGSPRLCL